jgi:hypothetical protein
MMEGALPSPPSESSAASSWATEVSRLQRRAAELTAASGPWAPLRGPAGAEALARLREVARPLLAEVARAYADRCPQEYPRLEDNGIQGPGGSIGLRLSPWHAVFFALEHLPTKRKGSAPKPAGLAGALGLQPKRMPGDPLPPPDPHVALELAVLAMRWDEGRGWVELRRPLPAAWTPAMLQEHLTAYLIGFNFDLARGLAPATGAPDTP